MDSDFYIELYSINIQEPIFEKREIFLQCKRRTFSHLNCPEMITITSDTCLSSDPWLCPSWIKSPCSLQLRFRLNKVKKTANLAVWDTTHHDKAIQELKDKFTEISYHVRTEIKHQYHFPGFVLAHWYDLIAVKQNQVLIIEVKPKDHWHNYKQYEYAQLLANQVYPKFVYFVYEYQVGKLKPKPIPDFDRVIATIQDKLSQTEKPEAEPNPQCVFCPYSQCSKHPQNSQ